MEPTYFADPAELRAWFERRHETATELWVGFRKVDSGLASITWPQSVDQALCFGWIDGIRKRVDQTAYKIRFTPRKPGSIWSAVNIAKVAELTAAGLMLPAGTAAFDRRTSARSGVYSHEQATAPEFSAEQEAALRAVPEAFAYFAAQPPGYRRQATWWVVSAKRAQTQATRLELLITHSAAGERVPPLRRPGS